MSGRNSVFLGLGGNLGDPQSAMAAALQAIDARGDTKVVAVSSLYRTPPWGKLDQPDFLNAVAQAETDLDARSLLDACLNAERALKRVRGERWGPRVIDIDLLWFNGQRIHEDGLHIPHPRMLERAFVMLPLAQIAPELDFAGQRADQISAALDQTGIEKITANGDWWRG